MKNLNILFIILLLLISCKASREIKTDKFFEKWEQDSKKYSEKKPTSELEKALSEIVSIELCKNDQGYYNNFPKLKYFIAQEKIKVSMSENFRATIALFSRKYDNFDDLLEKFKFKDSIFYNRINCNNNYLKPLILTSEYRKKALGKLRYGFGSSSFRRNTDNARVLLDSRYEKKYYTIPYRVGNVQFNESIDSAMVSTSTMFDGYGKLYTKENESWKFKKEIWHLSKD
jgi:hypothetical protein